jgi:hypothetical protein
MRRQRDDLGGRDEVVTLSDPAEVTGSGWTAVPSAEEAAARLADWARERRTVPDDLFARPLTVRDVSVTTLVVTRMFETRAEDAVIVTLPPTRLPVYEGPIERVDAGYEGWGSSRWEGLRDGSLHSVPCTGCSATGRVECNYCAGQGQLFCWPRQTCRWCGGGGRNRRLLGGGRGGTLCSRCRGSGQQVCYRCAGTSWRPCQVCAGGWIRCPVCTGSGNQVEYVRGTVTWTPSVRELVFGDLHRLGSGARRHYRSRGAVRTPDELPALPGQVATRLGHELAARPAGQVRMKAEVLVLLAAEVRFDDEGDERVAYLLGEDWTVAVPDARRLLRRLEWLGRRTPLRDVSGRARGAAASITRRLRSGIASS